MPFAPIPLRSPGKRKGPTDGAAGDDDEEDGGDREGHVPIHTGRGSIRHRDEDRSRGPAWGRSREAPRTARSTGPLSFERAAVRRYRASMTPSDGLKTSSAFVNRSLVFTAVTRVVARAGIRNIMVA